MPLEPEYLFCPRCVRETQVETPPCADGHGTECPDRACVDCGTAVLFDAQVIHLVHPHRRARRTAA